MMLIISKSVAIATRRLLFASFFLIGILSISINARATHIYGADLFYTHISGYKYAVSMYIYGDCKGAAFFSLPGSPTVNVYNGSTLYQTINLTAQAPTAGVEVTPVCPSQINNTQCKNTSNPIPGIMRFFYTDTITLNATSTNWRFRFNGSMSTSSSAGRSTSMTNLQNNTGSSVMNLEATLNNTTVTNSSPVYTTIPTPFYCINKHAQYNPGVIDADGDSLVHSLTAGLLPNNGTVTYKSGYSATSPLAATTGSFSFNSTTGQLNFIPNMIQRSLVVTEIAEYRNGVLVGTSMREMTFIVLNCSNNPPAGQISNNNSGTVDSTGTEVEVCRSEGPLVYYIYPTDPDTNNITMTISGLPAGAHDSLVSNGTSAPYCKFTWNLDSVKVGTHTFYITYLDDACPLSSKQTIAYKVTIFPDPAIAINVISNATCASKAVFSMTPSVLPAPWTLKVIQGSNVIHTFSSNNTQIDSLSPGTYTIRVVNAKGCYNDSSLVLDYPVNHVIPTASVVPVLCYGDSTGQINIIASGGTTPYKYAIDSGTYTSVNLFNQLGSGLYDVSILDSEGCKTDTIINIPTTPKLNIVPTVSMPSCYLLSDASITLSLSGGTPGYHTALNGGVFSNAYKYDSLSAGIYQLKIKDSNNCIVDTSLSVTSPQQLRMALNINNVQCFGDSSGSISINAAGGTPNYTYSWDSTSFSGDSVLSGMPVGKHIVIIRDNNGCEYDSLINIIQPAQLLVNELKIKDPTCENYRDGYIKIYGSGGTTPYTYAIGSSVFTYVNLFDSIKEGSYILKIRDGNGCEVDTPALLTGYPHIIIDSAFSMGVTCFGNADGSLSVYGSGGVGALSYSIDDNPFTPNKISQLDARGHQIVITDSAGCKKDTVINVPTPGKMAIEMKTIPNNCDGIENSGEIIAYVTGGTKPYKYLWQNGPGGNADSIKNIPAGLYAINVTDTNNCAAYNQVEMVYGECCHINIPSAFTPNGDGLNDVIRILHKGEFKLKIFSIYDRFGVRVFTTNDISEGWDGRWNGKLQDLNTYNYYAIGTCGTKDVMYKGTITLVR